MTKPSCFFRRYSAGLITETAVWRYALFVIVIGLLSGFAGQPAIASDEAAASLSSPGLNIAERILEAHGNEIMKIYLELDGRIGLIDFLKQQNMQRERIQQIFDWFKALAAELNAEGMRLLRQQQYKESADYIEQGLHVTERVVGKYHPVTIKSLNLLAELYKHQDYLERTEEYYLEALDRVTSIYGPTHKLNAVMLANLASLYTTMNRHDQALSRFKQALEITQTTDEGRSPATVNLMYNIAILLDSMGRISEAETYYQEAIEAAEAVYGESHPTVASGLNNLGLLYYASGKYADAEKLYTRAMRIYRDSYGDEHPAVSTAMNNLALLYTSTGKYDLAKSMYTKALAIDEKIYGKDHKNLISDLANLATLYKDTGDLEGARELYVRALQVGEKNLGRNHPALATNLNNLAMVHYLNGDYEKAEPLYRRALSIGRASLGEDNPEVATWMNNMALVLAARGDHAESAEMLVKTITTMQRKRDEVFTFMNDQEKLDYIQRNESIMYMLMDITSSHLGDNPVIVTETFNAWLRWKGALLESQKKNLDAVFHSDDAETKRLYESLMKMRKALAALEFSGPEDMTLQQYKDKLNLLKSSKDDMEVSLSRRSAKYALLKSSSTADIKDISSLLPEGSVYVDFADIAPINLKTGERSGRKYLAFVLVAGRGEPVTSQLIEIGDMQTVNGKINDFLVEMNSPEVFGIIPDKSVLDEISRELYTLLIKPIEQHLKGRRHLFISPAGNVNLLPFEVLMDEQGKYLIEQAEISYITAGRDIMRFSDTTKASDKAVIMADPDYDLSLPEQTALGPRQGTSRLIRAMQRFNFPRIPSTAVEADSIEEIMRTTLNLTVENLQRGDADERRLLEVSAPRILHLATHGFFLTDLALVQSDNPSKSENTKAVDNPMLRSGIVLSSVNTSLKSGLGSGIITAEKALALNIQGTDLVVLSACNTGVGAIERGEGVFGLKRAFLIAGSKSMMMSLWSVSSRETQEFMVTFYELLASGKGKASALRETKLKMMHQYDNPFFWGAFILVGKPS